MLIKFRKISKSRRVQEIMRNSSLVKKLKQEIHLQVDKMIEKIVESTILLYELQSENANSYEIVK